jgi:hypothetical protein
MQKMPSISIFYKKADLLIKQQDVVVEKIFYTKIESHKLLKMVHNGKQKFSVDEVLLLSSKDSPWSIASMIKTPRL